MPSAVSAIDIGRSLAGTAANEAGYALTTGETTLAETLGTVVKAVLSFAGVIFLSLMVYAGYLWMTARGEEAQIEKAQKMIRGAIIGLIITVGAYSITAFVVPKVLERTTGTSGGQGQVGAPRGNVCCEWTIRRQSSENRIINATGGRMVTDDAVCQATCRDQRGLSVGGIIVRCIINSSRSASQCGS